MSKSEELAEAREQLRDIKERFSLFRERTRKDVRMAQAKGRDEAAVPLLDTIDDCDRALRVMEDGAESGRTVTGVEQLRRRTLHHFSQLGYEPFGAEGEMFDPRQHEAVSVEPGAGVDGTVLRVHRRGWKRDGDVIRAAMVTVLQGSKLPEPEGVVAHAAEHRRRRRKTDYLCPWGISGCNADCAGCAPLADTGFEFGEGDEAGGTGEF